MADKITQLRIYETKLFKRGATTLALTIPASLVEAMGLANGERMELILDLDTDGDQFRFRRQTGPPARLAITADAV